MTRRGLVAGRAYGFNELHPLTTDVRSCLYRWTLFVSNQVNLKDDIDEGKGLYL